jgi:hypothetical protein
MYVFPYLTPILLHHVLIKLPTKEEQRLRAMSHSYAARASVVTEPFRVIGRRPLGGTRILITLVPVEISHPVFGLLESLPQDLPTITPRLPLW